MFTWCYWLTWYMYVGSLNYKYWLSGVDIQSISRDFKKSLKHKMFSNLSESNSAWQLHSESTNFQTFLGEHASYPPPPHPLDKLVH